VTAYTPSLKTLYWHKNCDKTFSSRTLKTAHTLTVKHRRR